MKLAASRWLIAVATSLPLLCAFSCGVALGPGYHIEKENVELSLVDQPEPRLHLQGRYRLENIGNAPLASLDVTVPEKDSLGRQNLRVTVDGKDAQITERSADNQTMSIVQISFDAPWTPHQKKDIEITCDIAAGSSAHTVLAPNAFAFDGAYWFPMFQAPKRLFAKGEQRADPTDLSFMLPKDFLAVTSGLQMGRKTRGETVEYRFRLREKDGAPFVVAGRYRQQIAKIKGTPVNFWTFQGLSDDAVASAGGQIAAAAQFFDTTFIARARGESPVWVVEIPENSISHHTDGVPNTTGSLPNMILLDKDVLSQNIGRGQVSPSEVGLLADTWLQWMASPEPANEVLPKALENYMVDAFYKSREGAPSRQMKIAEYLRQYDQSPARAMEKPIAQVTTGDSPDQLNMAVNKGSLFIYALEDVCKPLAFRRGVGNMLSTLRGTEYSYEDLRAALNIECGRTAGADELFRPWLYERGIPLDFHERYSGAAASQEAK